MTTLLRPFCIVYGSPSGVSMDTSSSNTARWISLRLLVPELTSSRLTRSLMLSRSFITVLMFTSDCSSAELMSFRILLNTSSSITALVLSARSACVMRPPSSPRTIATNGAVRGAGAPRGDQARFGQRRR